MRAGKCLPVTATEAIVRFKHGDRPVLDETSVGKDCYFRFQLGPDEHIALGLSIKTAGEKMIGQATELIANAQSGSQMPPYERLLQDAIIGDATLFAREDSVESTWRALGPILDSVTAVHEYEPGSWGPALSASIAPEGGWHDPEP